MHLSGDITLQNHSFGENKRRKRLPDYGTITSSSSGTIPNYANVMFSSTTGNTSNSYTLADATNINQ